MKWMIKKFKQAYHFLLAYLAYWYYGRPSRNMVVVGVTGTKGKSTTSRFVASVLEAAGNKVGMLTTVEFQVGNLRWANDKKMTMLGKGQIQKMLALMLQEGCTHVVVETSSEGILQYRHIGLNYDIVVFTNLGTEHSERHGGYEKLRADKGKIFASLNSSKKILNGREVPKIIVANGDDKEAPFFLAYDADKKYAYTFEKNDIKIPIEATIVHAEKYGVTPNGSTFGVDGENYELNIVGEFNQYNAAAAIVVGKALNIPYKKIKEAVASIKLVEGRMEFIEEGQPYQVVVDYAHEPLSLTALFTTLQNIVKPKNGRVIGVVGSDGGGRDKKKRSIMGEIAGKLCDYVFITDVNCYDEDPEAIADMLAEGALKAGKTENENLFIDVDRRAAIKLAFTKAEPGDVVAITAKGTEPFIGVANGKKIPWDDRRIARELIREVNEQNKLTA